MGRLDVLKRLGFPEEDCPHDCDGSNEDCICGGTGKFTQKVRSDFELPVLEKGQRLIAYCDFDEWASIAVCDKDGNPIREVQWPFDTDFANDRHLKTLGFEIER